VRFYLWENDAVSPGLTRLDSGFSLLEIVTIMAVTRISLPKLFRASSKIQINKNE